MCWKKSFNIVAWYPWLHTCTKRSHCTSLNLVLWNMASDCKSTKTQFNTIRIGWVFGNDMNRVKNLARSVGWIQNDFELTYWSSWEWWDVLALKKNLPTQFVLPKVLTQNPDLYRAFLSYCSKIQVKLKYMWKVDQLTVSFHDTAVDLCMLF